MAKEENPSPPLIDYEGASAAAQSANQGNAFADCKRHWKTELFRIYKVGGIAWGVERQTMLSRLLKEFEPEDVKAMMTAWIKEDSKSVENAVKFNWFYKNRYVLHQRTQDKVYDW